MKKLLLFMMVIGFVFSGMAQNQYVSKKNDKRALEGTSVNSNNELPTPILNTKAVNEDVNRITVGVSDNQRSFRREEPHVITYNAELDLISLTMTIDPATYDEASALGVIAQFYSTDHGQTWQGPVVLADNTGDGFQNYYPAGMTYNPTGNTSVTGAYGVSQSTNTIWNYHVFGSSSLG
ncbi:MAG: hypothetical protein GQ527_09485, partial [Bacteroidales bacterium]|nr:hypothetical protein [Bacteroidales bacterium]